MGGSSNAMPGGIKMRANRKVLEGNCGICQGGFALGEEVYPCPACGGYHHTACLDSGARCPQASEMKPPEPVPASPPEGQVANAAEPVWTPVPVSAPNAGVAEQPVSAPAAAVPPAPPPPPPPPLSPEAQKRRQQIAETYKEWSTERLEYAYSEDRKRYDPMAVEVMEEELKSRRASEPWTCPDCATRNSAGMLECVNQANHLVSDQPAPAAAANATPLAPDERKCPTCAEIVKRDALKCRFCGQILGSDAYSGTALVGTVLTPETPPSVIAEIEKLANDGLWCAIGSLVCCGPILGPLGISKGNRANSLLDQHPEYRSSARGKARAAQIIGWIAIILFVIGLILRIANAS
jgi:hypothetical protein